MNGSPPFNRTTACPACASRTRMALMPSCGTEWRLRCFGNRNQAGIGICKCKDGIIHKPVVHHDIGSRDPPCAFTVSKSGSPGPAPTR